MQNKVALGIDISKLKFDTALLESNKYKTKSFTNNNKGFAELIAWLNKNNCEQPHVCLEATGIYGDALSNYLVDQNLIVSIVNPAQIKGFGISELSRTKTDKADAKLIARFCQTMNPEPWKPLPAEIRELRSLVKHLESLIRLRQEEENRLEVSAAVIQPSLQKIIYALKTEINATKAKIKNHINNNPTLKEQYILLATIPGVGEATIAQILSIMATPERFANAKKLIAFIGLNPKHHQSGSSVKRSSHISKTGDGTLRHALFMPAIVAKQYNPVLKALYERLVAAGKPKMLAICAVMRKLLHIIYGVLKSGVPFNPNYEDNKYKIAIT
jgi:transposase